MPLTSLIPEFRTSTLTARFGAIENPLADGRGSDRSPDREGGVAFNGTILRGRRTSRGAGNPARGPRWGRLSGGAFGPRAPDEFRTIGGADPLVRAGPPGPALGCQNQLLGASVWPARGPAADGGVRPTIYADARQTGRGIGRGQDCLPHE